MLYPPYNFGVVDEGIYRSGAPTSINISFLKSLNLKTIVYLAGAGPTAGDIKTLSYIWCDPLLYIL